MKSTKKESRNGIVMKYLQLNSPSSMIISIWEEMTETTLSLVTANAFVKPSNEQ